MLQDSDTTPVVKGNESKGNKEYTPGSLNWNLLLSEAGFNDEQVSQYSGKLTHVNEKNLEDFMNDQALFDMGITVLGHQLKIMKAAKSYKRKPRRVPVSSSPSKAGMLPQSVIFSNANGLQSPTSNRLSKSLTLNGENTNIVSPERIKVRRRPRAEGKVSASLLHILGKTDPKAAQAIKESHKMEVRGQNAKGVWRSPSEIVFMVKHDRQRPNILYTNNRNTASNSTSQADVQNMLNSIRPYNFLLGRLRPLGQ